MKAHFLLFLLIIAAFPVFGQKHFDFNTVCVQAYQQALTLRIDGAQQLLNQEKQRNPNNLAPHFIENYIDFFILFLNEDARERANRIGNWKARLALMEQAPDSSPLKLFTKSIINLHWAVIEIKFGNRWAAGWAFRDAFKLARTNESKFPQFTPNLMITGPMQMAASTIPNGYKWLSNLLGIKGTMAQGQANIQQFLRSGDSWARLFMNEGIFYQCYMQFYLLNQPDQALQFIRTRRLDLVNNHLFTFMAANLSLNNKQSAQTQAIVKARNMGPEYLNTAIWDFELAYAKLNHLEADAGFYLERYLSRFKGKFYVKECWMKLATHYLLQNNMDQYQRCIRQVLTQGSLISDADKRALREAKSGKIPNLLLLKARLLNDGGYQQEALTLLAGKSSASFEKEEEKLEFMYRVARIYDDLDRIPEAMQAYQSTIQMGKHRTEYYAARSALQMGLLYEKRGDKARAIEFFNLCISMENHDFKDSLDQKAKAGIGRCKG